MKKMKKVNHLHQSVHLRVSMRSMVIATNSYVVFLMVKEVLQNMNSNAEKELFGTRNKKRATIPT